MTAEDYTLKAQDLLDELNDLINKVREELNDEAACDFMDIHIMEVKKHLKNMGIEP